MNRSSSILKAITVGLVLITSLNVIYSQDTFSIVAVDPETGEVGSAGASCVDLANFPGLETGFLAELFPGVGAINTQAAYNQTNQANARNRMNASDTPQEIIDWLVANDVQNQAQQRQYGVVALVDGAPQSAAHTGSSNFDYKNHITGTNYSIQGNILLGQEILDSMEAQFLRAEGDLSCRLMAAMQGANVIGADNRCTDNGTSSLFAFLKVAQTDDSFGSPSLSLGVRFQDGQGIEPIDRLQEEFDAVYNCLTSTSDPLEFDNLFDVFPNPVSEFLTLQSKDKQTYHYKIVDLQGKTILKKAFVEKESTIDISHLNNGNYIIEITKEGKTFSKLISKN